MAGHTFLLKSASPMIAKALANINLAPDDKVHVIVPDFSRALVAKCLEFMYTGGVTVKNKPEMEKVFQFMMKHLLINLTYNDNVIITLSGTSGLKRISALEFDHVKIKKQKQENSTTQSFQQLPGFKVKQPKTLKSSNLVDRTDAFSSPEKVLRSTILETVPFYQQELDNPRIEHLSEPILSSAILETVFPDRPVVEHILDLTEDDALDVEVLGRLCDQMLAVNAHPNKEQLTFEDEPTTVNHEQPLHADHQEYQQSCDTADSTTIQISGPIEQSTQAKGDLDDVVMIEEENIDEENVVHGNISLNAETVKSAITAPDLKVGSSRAPITPHIVAQNQFSTATNPEELKTTNVKRNIKKETNKLKNLKVNLINRMNVRQRRFSKSAFASNRILRSSSTDVAFLKEISRRNKKKIKTEVPSHDVVHVESSRNSETSAAIIPQSNFEDFSLYEDLTQCLLCHYSGTEDEASMERFKQLRKSDKRIDDLAFGILEVFEGLDILKFASDEKRYKWSGIEKTKISVTLANILNDKNKLDTSVSWKEFCDVVSLLIPCRKGSRIFPKQSGKGLMMALAILKAVNMVKIPADPAGGIIWIGEEDLFMVWDRIQIQKYSNVTSVPLKQGRLVLQRCHASEEQIKAALERSKNFETLRSTETKKQNCSCGGLKMIAKNWRNQKRLVRIGQKRRQRCQKCPACLRPPCRKCKFCKNRSFKKPCQERVCLSPLLPRCPCFK